MNAGCGNGFDGQHRETSHEGQQEYCQDSKMAAGSEARDASFNGAEPRVSQARAGESQHNGDDAEAKLYQQQQAESFSG